MQSVLPGQSGQGWLLLSPDDRIKQESSLTENLNCVSELGREREQTGKGCVCVCVRARVSCSSFFSIFNKIVFQNQSEDFLSLNPLSPCCLWDASL